MKAKRMSEAIMSEADKFDPSKLLVHDRIYVSIKTGIYYPLTDTGNSVDMDRPLSPLINLKAYKKIGENNAFTIYDLKKRYKK